MLFFEGAEWEGNHLYCDRCEPIAIFQQLPLPQYSSEEAQGGLTQRSCALLVCSLSSRSVFLLSPVSRMILLTPSNTATITRPVLLGRYETITALATNGELIALAEKDGEQTRLSVRRIEEPTNHTSVTTRGIIERLTIAKELVIWREQVCPGCPGKIEAYRHATGQRLTLAEASDELLPAAWGRWLACVSRNGRNRILTLDLERPSEPVTLTYVAQPDQQIKDSRLQLGALYWLEQGPDGWAVRMLQVLDNEEPRSVLHGEGDTPLLLPLASRIVQAREKLIFQDNQHEPVLGDPPDQPELLTSSERCLFWTVPLQPNDRTCIIYGFDVISLSRFVAIPATTDLTRVVAGGTGSCGPNSLQAGNSFSGGHQSLSYSRPADAANQRVSHLNGGISPKQGTILPMGSALFGSNMGILLLSVFPLLKSLTNMILNSVNSERCSTSNELGSLGCPRRLGPSMVSY